MIEIVQEMRLFSADGERLYLTNEERHKFLEAATNEEREHRVFCSILHYTGCRPSEALELTPKSILMSDKEIVFRTLKKEKSIIEGERNCHNIEPYLFLQK